MHFFYARQQAPFYYLVEDLDGLSLCNLGKSGRGGRLMLFKMRTLISPKVRHHANVILKSEHSIFRRLARGII